MKVYLHLCFDEFTNCYLITNDDPKVMEAIIIDPGKITNEMIQLIEDSKYKVTGVLITHNHENHCSGLKTLLKIYNPVIYAADTEIAGKRTVVLRGDGKKKIAGLKVEYFSVPGHTSDSMVFKIGNLLFTGDTIESGTISDTSSLYAQKLLRDKIKEKIFSQTEATCLMPGHGPPTSIECEKKFNIDMGKTI